MKSDDIIAAARRRMGEAVEADRDNREEALDDLENIIGRGQWPEDVRLERENEGRPVITINRLPQFVRQVTGDLRNMNPAVKVLPADGDATKEVAEVMEGLARHIEHRSDASSVYEGAAESAASCGMGAFRILTEYEDDDTFNQEIRIELIHNPFSVYWDPESRMSTREDAQFCFITDQISAEDFKERYPDASPVDADHDSETDLMNYWHEDGAVIVAEYMWKEPVRKDLHLLIDGTISDAKGIPKEYIQQTRKVDTHRVMWAKISGHDVLEGPEELPCYHIPVVAVMGEEMHVGGEVVRTSVIRFAKDPQRLYNYWSSAQTELVALQPKAPFLVTAKQVQGFETFWNEANNSNRPYLPYNADEKAGTPTRAQPPVASQGMMTEIAKAAEDMQATTGIYNAGLGQRSNEVSGVAIRQRQMESDISTSIYSDNMAKAITQCGRILVDMIPKIYDTDRMVRIVGVDDVEKLVEINGLQVSQDGVVPINPLGSGKYDVRVSVGPNYSTKRQETVESMISFLQAYPAAAPVVGDLLAKNMDWPGADELAERLKKMLPPGMIDIEDMEPEEQQRVMQEQQAMQAQQQQMEQMQQAIAELQMRKDAADAAKSEADAAKSSASAEKTAQEAAKIQFELAVQSGLMNEVIRSEVARVLQGQMQQPMGQF